MTAAGTTELPVSPPPRPRGRGRKVATAWLVVGSIGAVVLLVVGPIAVTSLVAHEERTVHRSFAVDAVRTVDVDVDEGEVTVVGDAAGAVQVDALISRGLRDTATTIDLQGDRLVVRAHCRGPLTEHCRMDVVVHVPPTVAVVGRTSDAPVQVRAIAGEVRIGTTDGDVGLESLTGVVRVDNRDGSVTGTGLGAGPVRVDTRDGDVDVTFAVPPTGVSATTRDGAVSVVVPEGSGPYAVSATSGDGDVSTPVRTDPTSERAVHAASRDGDVAVRYPGT